MTGEFAIAVHALVFLNHMQKTVSSEALAANVCTNPARIRKVMSKLKRAGMLKTKEGAEGGYYFCGEAEKVSLLMVLDALQQNSIDDCWRSGDPDMECMIASGMANVMDGIYQRMNDVCGKELAQISISDIDQKIFHKDLLEK